MNNLNKFRKSTVAILTALLIISIAAPLLSFAVAATTATVSITPASGPNGTAVKVTGTGFSSAATLHIIVDGIEDTKVTRTGSGLVASKELAVDANGALTGYFIIGGAGTLNLAAGPHTVQIYDSVATPAAVTFTITTPTVTLSPTSGPAGTSVVVTASGFPTSITGVYTVTNRITAATFAGTTVTVNGPALYATTASATTLSSNTITAGAFSATVSLPQITSGSAFTLTDNLGNTGTYAYSLNTPTITLSPNSGPVGTIVTVTATGFGPGAQFTGTSPVTFGSTASVVAGAALVPASPYATEQGTCVFQFTVGTYTIGTATVDDVAGAHTVTVVDSLKNTATASFTVTPKATVTVGSTTVNSGITHVPTGASSKLYLVASGFAPNTVLSITGSAGVPANWLVFSAASVTTDANGAIASAVACTTAANAPGDGVYQITVSDGVNAAQKIDITVEASTEFFVLTPSTGVKGTTVAILAYSATSGTSVSAADFDGATLTLGGTATTVTWPVTLATAVAASATFTVPASTAGQHVIAVTTPALKTASFITTTTTTISIVSPSSGAPGTTATIVGSGFAAEPTLTIDGKTTARLTHAISQGQVVITFAIPNFLAGAHTIILTDAAGNTASSTVSVVVPTVTVSPTSGTLGAEITITGSGFKAGETITVSGLTMGGTLVGLSTINPNGGILLYTGITIPSADTVAGPHTITVAGTTSGNAATVTFTTQPSITLTPSAVRANAYSVIAGKGFAASKDLTLTVNGTAQTWYNPVTYANTTVVTTDANGNIPTNAAVIVNAATASGSLTIAVTDASSNTASKTLTVLSAPAITLNPTSIVSGSPAKVSIAGTGWTVGTRAESIKLFNSAGTEIVSALTLTSGAAQVVTGTGALPAAAETFSVASGLPAGVYTVQYTLATPTESANATLTIMSAASVTIAPTTATIGSNVSISILGLAPVISGTVYPITIATIGATNILTATWGTKDVPVTGANAYNLTTWFIVPTGILGGSYTLTVGDGTRSATTQITIAGSATLTPASGSTNYKGSTVNVAGTGFGTSGIAYSITVNGVSVTTGTVGAGGAISTSFTVPITATANSTVVITDAAGNTATSYLTVTAPTLTLIPSEAAPGQAVQIFGSGFNGVSSIFIQIGNTILTTNPSPLTASAGSFVAVITVPTGLSGNQTITATDASNNVGIAYLTVTGGSGVGVPNQTTMTNTAKTTTPSGTPATTFTAGSSAQASFTLQSTSGSRDVVVAVTWQQGAKVYGMSSMQTTMDATGRTMSFQQLIPAGATGTWTATLQVFAADGTTPLGVSTLTFTVA